MPDYIFKGKPIDESLVVEAAEVKGLTVEEYVNQKEGLELVVIDPPAKKTDGVPGAVAPSGPQPAPTMESVLETGFSGLQDPTEVNNVYTTPLTPEDKLDTPYWMLQKMARENNLTVERRNQILDEGIEGKWGKKGANDLVRDALEMSVESKDIDQQTFENYFPLDIIEAPIEIEGASYKYGGGSMRPVTAEVIKQRIFDYAFDNNLDEQQAEDYYNLYLNYKNDGDLTPINDLQEQTLSALKIKSEQEVRSKNLELISRDYSEEVRQRALQNLGGYEQNIESILESTNQLNDLILKYEDEVKSYSAQYKPTADKINALDSEIESLKQRYENQPRPALLDLYQRKINERNKLASSINPEELARTEADLGAQYAKISDLQNKRENKILATTAQYGDLEKGSKNYAATLEALNKNYSWTTRAGYMMEQAFGGATATVGSYIYKGLTYATAAGLSGPFKPVDVGYINKKIIESGDAVVAAAADYNLAIEEKIKKELPQAVTVEDVKSGRASIGSFIYDSSANATPTLATIFAPMKAVKILGTGAKALKGAEKIKALGLAADRYRKAANVSSYLMGVQTGGGMISGVEIGKLQNPKQIALLKEKLETTKDPIAISKINDQIAQLENTMNKSSFTTGLSGLVTGSITRYTEKLITLGLFDDFASMANQTGKNVWLNLFNTGKTLTGAVIKEEGQEIAEQILTTGVAKNVILGENVNIFDGVDLDLVANTAVATTLMLGGKTMNNTHNILAEHFTSKEEQASIQSKIDELQVVMSLPTEERITKTKQILADIGLADVVSLSKLNLLNKQELNRVGEIQAELNRLSRAAQRLAAGIQGLPTDQDIKAIKNLEDQYNDLSNQKEKILLTKRKTNQEFLKKKQIEASPERLFHLALFDSSNVLASSMVGKGNEIIFIEHDENGNKDFSSIEKFKGQKIKYKDDEGVEQEADIYDLISEGTNAGYNFGNVAIVDMLNARQAIATIPVNSDGKFAAVSALHEVSHIRNKGKKLKFEGDSDEAIANRRAVTEAITAVDDKFAQGSISEEDYNTIKNRLEVYEKDGDYEEFMQVLSDARLLGVLTKGDFSNPSLAKPFIDLFQNIMVKTFGDQAQVFAQFNTGSDVFNYIENFRKNAIQGVVVNELEEEDQLTLSASKINDLAKKYKEGNITAEEEASLVKQYNRIALGPGLNFQGYKSRQAEQEGLKAISREDAIGEVGKYFSGILERFNPETSDFSTWVVNNIRPKRQSFYEQEIGGKEVETRISDERAKELETIAEETTAPVTEVDTDFKLVDSIRVDKKPLEVEFKDKVRKFVTEQLKDLDPQSETFRKQAFKPNKDFINFIKNNLLGKSITDYRDFIRNNPNFVKGLNIAALIKFDTGLVKQGKPRLFTEFNRRLTTQKDIEKFMMQGRVPYLTVKQMGQGANLYNRLKPTETQIVNFLTNEIPSTVSNRKTAIAREIANRFIAEAAPSTEMFQAKPLEARAKTAEKLQVSPTAKFSRIAQTLFDLGLKGRSKVDSLLTKFDLERSLDLKKLVLTQEGRDKITNAFETVIFPLLDRDAWLQRDSFTSSNANYNISISKGTKTEIDAFYALKEQIKSRIENAPDSAFGSKVKDSNGNIIDYKISGYATVFKGTPSEIKTKAEEFNRKVTAIHETLWERIADTISKDKSKASIIATYLKLTANDKSSWHRRGAAIFGYSPNPKAKGKTIYEMEHAMPATSAYLYLLDSAITNAGVKNSTFKEAYKLISDNYKLIALDKVENSKLGKAKLGTSMPRGWDVLENFWWQRYFNEEVAKFEGGIDPNSIVDINGNKLGDLFNIDSFGKAINSEVAKSTLKASKINNKLQPNGLKYDDAVQNATQLASLSTLDKAFDNARDIDAPIKKIRVFDFDDTLARSKSKVLYTVPNVEGGFSEGATNLKAIFMVGGPGAGKTNVGKGLQLGRRGYKVVNQDIALEAMKEEAGLPAKESDYTAEQRSMRSKLGAAARKAAVAKFDKYAAAGNGMVIDGTGASYNATTKKIKALQDAGFEVHMVVAMTPLETALERNRARAERSLPDFVVEKTYQQVQESLAKYREDFGDRLYEINTETIEYGKPLPNEFLQKVYAGINRNKVGKVDASNFATEYDILESQGAQFDFREFSKVIDGKKGPLFSVAEKIAAARGTDDVFILTARPADAAKPIQDFMKEFGVDIPLKNITGLGDGTAAAKARWVVGKAAEGYNDFYFADDAVKNVRAVKDALSVLDVKSKTQQAKVKFSKTNLSKEFNKIIEGKTGIGAEKTYARVKAEVAGAGKGRFSFFIAPSAEDFTGLLYTTLGKGKVGDEQMAWYKTHLLNPYARAMQNISRDRIHMINDFNALKKELKVVPKDLKKKIPGEPFTKEQAVRVYIWNKQGMEVPGLSKADLKELTDHVDANETLKVFADQLTNILKGDQYAKPGEGWPVGSITTDLLETLNTTKRAKYLERWKQNVDEIFSEQNLNKLQAAFGKSYREALENILKRMETGRNRSFSGDSLTGRFTDWLTGSIGVTMFFNTRSAILQTISAVNFINFTDNNILAASRAFANQKQFWADFVTLMNSDFLKERRSGLRINVNEADIADMARQGGVRGVVNKLLEFGFTPTQIADSFAIASGGATFYRNRIKTYTKQGMALEAAERKALDDWRETSEESQQSSRPDRISQQQAGPLGRIILAFANTPAQYARIIKKAALDLKNGRGDAKTNISKIIYYGAAQNLIFNALQQALFAFAFGEGDDDDEKKKDKYMSIGNGMLDSLLRGIGIAGAVTSVVKNAVIRINTELDKDRPKLEKVGYEIAKLSPPVSAKLSRINQAARAYQWHKDEMKEKGWSLDNPAFLASANVIAAATNVPLDRLIIKINNVNTAINQDLDTWQRMALIGGWRDWELGIKEEKKKKRKSKFKTKKFGKVKF